MSKLPQALRWFLAGVGAGAAILLLAWIFLAYQQPQLLLEWVNLRYCG